MDLAPLPDSFAATRGSLHRVATHVLARRRHRLCGKFGLRSSPGGFGTPACGPEHEVIRVSGTLLVRERTGETASTASLDLTGATLAAAAELASVDLSAPFDAGRDTPPVGDPAGPLTVEPVAAAVLAAWYHLGWVVLDAILGGLAARTTQSVVQLWPEHFDAGCSVEAAPGRHANLGASPGDGWSAQPYLYVGPWDAPRPGDPRYWNAPFGAALTYEELGAAGDPVATGLAFVRRGLALLAG